MDYQNGVIEDLGAVMGTEAAMRLIAIYGGASLYVPAAASDEHAICRVIGRKPFDRLCEAYGGETIDLPEHEEFSRLRRVRQVARLLSSGHRVREIAAFLGMSERQVANYRAQAEELFLVPMVFSGKKGKGQMPLVADAEQ